MYLHISSILQWNFNMMIPNNTRVKHTIEHNYKSTVLIIADTFFFVNSWEAPQSFEALWIHVFFGAMDIHKTFKFDIIEMFERQRIRDVYLQNLEIGRKSNYLLHTYGNFILMNTRHIKKEIKIEINPTHRSRIRFRRGIEWLVLSNMINPRPPIVKRKLEANPSIMYWPFTL